MQIQIRTDNHIEGSERLENYFSEVLHTTLKRFEDKITGLEVHITDENNAGRSGNADIRCLIEARVKGHEPVSATHHADTTEKAINGATDKIKKVLEHTFDKMRTH